jgi:hypothetical protein
MLITEASTGSNRKLQMHRILSYIAWTLVSPGRRLDGFIEQPGGDILQAATVLHCGIQHGIKSCDQSQGYILPPSTVSCYLRGLDIFAISWATTYT